jgi:hypothetical protein
MSPARAGSCGERGHVAGRGQHAGARQGAGAGHEGGSRAGLHRTRRTRGPRRPAAGGADRPRQRRRVRSRRSTFPGRTHRGGLRDVAGRLRRAAVLFVNTASAAATSPVLAGRAGGDHGHADGDGAQRDHLRIALPRGHWQRRSRRRQGRPVVSALEAFEFARTRGGASLRGRTSCSPSGRGRERHDCWRRRITFGAGHGRRPACGRAGGGAAGARRRGGGPACAKATMDAAAYEAARAPAAGHREKTAAIRARAGGHDGARVRWPALGLLRGAGPLPAAQAASRGRTRRFAEPWPPRRGRAPAAPWRSRGDAAWRVTCCAYERGGARSWPARS